MHIRYILSNYMASHQKLHRPSGNSYSRGSFRSDKREVLFLFVSVHTDGRKMQSMSASTSSSGRACRTPHPLLMFWISCTQLFIEHGPRSAVTAYTWAHINVHWTRPSPCRLYLYISAHNCPLNTALALPSLPIHQRTQLSTEHGPRSAVSAYTWAHIIVHWTRSSLCRNCIYMSAHNCPLNTALALP
jgi:hypothetical protein